jgi:hypothetical protein
LERGGERKMSGVEEEWRTGVWKNRGRKECLRRGKIR